MAGAGWAGEAEGKRGAGGLVQKLLEMVASLYEIFTKKRRY